MTVALPELSAEQAYDLVYAALECRPSQSLTQAAFQVMRLNCHPPHVLEVARIVLGGGNGQRPEAQWDALQRAAAVIVKHHAEHATPTVTRPT